MSSFLHSPAWERFQKKIGNDPHRQGDNLFLEKKVSGAVYWLSSRCSLDETFTPPPFTKNGWFLRLEPLDEKSQKNLANLAKTTKRKLIPTFAVQPRQTIVLDLKKSYEDLLKEMKSKHRYNVRVAQRHEIAVEVVSKTASDSFERFWNLLSSTANRQDFRTHSKNYYKVMVEELAKDEEAHLVFASKDGQDLAALLLITHNGTATYLHGGSSDKNKELMAPFLLHAETIKFAKEFGCHTYDLWGTDLEWNAEKSEWQPISGKASAGTSRFKVGFGGEVISYPGTFDLILKPFWYTLYTFIRAIRGGKRAFS